MNTLENRRLHVVYVSSLVSRADFRRIFGEGKRVPSIAAQKFHRLMVEGLASSPDVTVVAAVGSPPISRQVSSRLVHPARVGREGAVRYVTLPFINAPVLRQGVILLGACAVTARESLNKPSVVFCDVLCGAPSLAALMVGAITRTPVIGIVTDVPLKRPNVGSRLDQLRARVMQTLGTTWLARFDGYVILTEAMNDVVNPRRRPSIVVEGLVDIDDEPAGWRRGESDRGVAGDEREHSPPSVKRTILYTGSTHRVYGLGTLVEAFRSADLTGWELHICGSGDFDADLVRIAQEDSRVTFHGVVENERAVEMQRSATLLVNPRPSGHEFTKYSFPSKNMEYMASGRPLMATRLPGMPEEYFPHLLLIDDESIDGMRNVLRHVAALGETPLTSLGAGAREFVKSRKNKCAQASRVLDLVKQVLPR